MATFVLIHGGGDVGWAWHLVEAELRARGHDTVAPDLPCEDDSADLDAFAGAVLAAVGDLRDRRDLVVVGHSYGGFTAPLVADRLQADLLVLMAGMVPSPGEPPNDWWANTGYAEAAAKQADLDGGLTGSDDLYVLFYNGVSRPLAEEALGRGRDESSAAGRQPWPLPKWPDVPTRFVLFGDDHLFPADFFRRLVPERLGITPDELPGCHCAMLSHPKELADTLVGYLEP
ncbi:Alpha/beta hydrolase family protein [Actinopolymorpha cephalotaxi]|uniref:Alpha/beta hydrolase family protein n=1 Tax=Actinopolymorpha cephalotaxi TaxID=504797 RepID=A0A1I2M350_9ACTN|nr:alpha/beta hydrolase [Actinopolymorpha cephalotaxi]NYH81565.1 pimeloyl-ACP methyl ester carboxylesterase [Actinopolymorpha cephalotaxi]SFF85954.1 Alpha/beta hydrolase family protein [Actinopolymorpha cephalotaxi]